MFTPSAVEVEWARGRTKDDQHLLALLVWLKAQRHARAVFVPERIELEREGADGTPGTVVLSVDVDAFASALWRKILKDPARPQSQAVR